MSAEEKSAWKLLTHSGFSPTLRHTRSGFKLDKWPKFSSKSKEFRAGPSINHSEVLKAFRWNYSFDLLFKSNMVSKVFSRVVIGWYYTNCLLIGRSLFVPLQNGSTFSPSEDKFGNITSWPLRSREVKNCCSFRMVPFIESTRYYTVECLLLQEWSPFYKINDLK